MPALSHQWLFDLPGDKDVKIEKLSGDLELGGNVSGRITGSRAGDGRSYC